MLKPEIHNKKIDYSEIDLTPSPQGLERIQYHTIGQLIAKARMERKPLIVVEGKDDISIYEQLIKKVNLKANIRAIETIPGYSEGCYHVKKFIENSQEEINKSPKNKKFLLGVIDRDAMYYRKEIKKRTKCLFVLNSYSFESHFVTKNHITHALEHYLTSSSGINNQIIDYIYSEFDKKIEELYYISIEALINSCRKNYNGIIGFSADYGQIKYNSLLYTQILTKKDKLNNYARLRKISHKDITLIKGKWLLDAFVDIINEQVKLLADNCKTNHTIPGQERCPFCIENIANKCNWLPRKHYTDKLLRSFILQFIEDSEVEYILKEFQKLG